MSGGWLMPVHNHCRRHFWPWMQGPCKICAEQSEMKRVLEHGIRIQQEITRELARARIEVWKR